MPSESTNMPRHAWLMLVGCALASGPDTHCCNRHFVDLVGVVRSVHHCHVGGHAQEGEG